VGATRPQLLGCASQGHHQVSRSQVNKPVEAATCSMLSATLRQQHRDNSNMLMQLGAQLPTPHLAIAFNKF